MLSNIIMLSAFSGLSYAVLGYLTRRGLREERGVQGD